MREKKRRAPGARGFTAIEVVVTVVVLAILAAYATPKLFGLKDRAKETEETMKIQDIESRHAKEMLEQGKLNGSLPTLGGTVGFREAVASEEAPDTAPMLVDWRWSKIRLLPAILAQSPSIIPSAVGGYILTAEYNDASKSFRCANAWEFVNPLAANGSVFVTSPGTSIEKRWKLNSFTSAPLAPYEDVPITEPSPHCSLTLNLDYFARNAMHGMQPMFENARGTWHHLEISGDSELVMYDNRAYDGTPSATTTIKARPWELMPSGTSPAEQAEATPSASEFRYDCSHYSARYGVPYLIKGAYPTSYNGSETADWTIGSDRTFDGGFIATTPYKIGAGDLYVNRTDPARSGFCERQGPAPVVPPTDPGSPGTYPIASDGSGYCLSPGRKLPTYKNASGTPTTSPSDPVAELAAEAVDDPTNCPG